MFVTKKGSNLRRPTGKMRNPVLIPSLKRNIISNTNESSIEDCNTSGMKENCKRKFKESVKKTDKTETIE